VLDRDFPRHRSGWFIRRFLSPARLAGPRARGEQQRGTKKEGGERSKAAQRHDSFSRAPRRLSLMIKTADELRNNAIRALLKRGWPDAPARNTNFPAGASGHADAGYCLRFRRDGFFPVVGLAPMVLSPRLSPLPGENPPETFPPMARPWAGVPPT